jgi:parvulin-like peptidyl-prolyl isomerase
LDRQKISTVVSVVPLVLLLSSCGGKTTEDTTKSSESTTTTTTSSENTATPAEKSADTSSDSKPNTPIVPTTIKNGTTLGSEQTFPVIPDGAHLEKLPNEVTVCSIDSVPLTMNEYRRQFKTQQQEVQAALSVNQNDAVGYFLKFAKQRGIVLDASERARLLKTAHMTESIDKKKFDQFLTDNKMSIKQFDDQVLDVGLAAKAGNRMIEDSLLSELVNRQMLASAAKENGFSKQGYNKFLEIKKTDNFKKMQKATGFTDQELEDEIVKNQLSQLMIAKLRKENPLSDADLRKFYDEHKDKLKHGARIRISQIVLACPKVDLPNVQSVKTTIQKANPKLTGAALDQKVAEEIAKKKAKAQSLLDQVKKGADFAKLANENTEDPSVKDLHNGGDTGFQDKQRIEAELVTACNQLEINDVVPQVVETPYGFHVIKLTGREGPGTVPYDEVKDQLRSLLEPKHDDETCKKWLMEQRKKVKIVFSPEFEAALKSAQKGESQTANKTESGETAAKRQVH